MTKPFIALVDLDNVIADQLVGFYQEIAKQYPEITLPDRNALKEFDLEYNFPFEDWKKIKSLRLQEGFFRDLPLIEGAREGLERLADQATHVRIVTAPTWEWQFCVPEKYEWVEKHLGREWTGKIILTRVTSHSKSVSGLLACTLYWYRVVSADAAGNYATSTGSGNDATTFTTTGCVGNTTAVSVSSGTVTVAAPSQVTGSMPGSRSLKVLPDVGFTNAASSVTVQVAALSANTVLNSIGKPSSSLISGSTYVFQPKVLIDNLTEIDTFDEPITLTFTYNESDLTETTESSLKMYRYDGSSWTEMTGCTRDTTTNTIECETTNFSIFAIFGNAQSSSTSSSTGASGGGGTLLSRIQNLIASGNYTAAVALLHEWSRLLGNQAIAEATTPAQSIPTFTRDLETGMTGGDVRLLQQTLNRLGYTLATDGPGSPGNETERFGALTRAALIRYQKDKNITPAIGYFGPKTRAVIAQNTTNLVDSN